MPCAAYDDHRLAAVYDPLNPPGADTDFHRAVIGTAPVSVLDMGCGTGSFAVDLARLGHRVTGADPATGMLDIARKRAGGDRVFWVASDAAGLDLPERFDRIVMTGHVFQVFLNDHAVSVALKNLRRHLAEGGKLSFETRKLSARDWLTWTPDETATTVSVAGIGDVGVHYQVTDVAGDIVTYETHFCFPDPAVAVAESRLRFWEPEPLFALLRGAGFASIEAYGDWDGSTVSAHSPEIIVIASP